MPPKRSDTDELLKLKLQNKTLEEDLDNMMMKNNVLLKMNQKIKEEKKNFQEKFEIVDSKAEKMRIENLQLQKALRDTQENTNMESKLKEAEENAQ